MATFLYQDGTKEALEQFPVLTLVSMTLLAFGA